MTDAEALDAIELILGEPPAGQYLSNVEAHERILAISDIVMARQRFTVNIEDEINHAHQAPPPLGLLWTPGSP